MKPGDTQEIEKAVQAIEKVAGGALIRAIDIFFSHKYPDPIAGEGLHATTISFGDEEYLSDKGVLADFFLKFGTLSLSKESIKIFGDIEGENRKSLGKKIFKTLDAPQQALRPASIEEMAQHLAHWHFGKSFVLCTVYHPVRSIEVYLSVFVVFDNSLDSDLKALVGEEIAWWMLKDVSNLISGLLSTESVRIKEEMSLTESLVKVVRHMIKNIPLNANLMALKKALDNQDINKAKSIYQTIARREKLRDLTTDILYSFKLDPKELLLHKYNFTKYSAIIELMIGGHPEPEQISVHGFSDEIESHPANSIPIHQSINALTILVNVWSNTTKALGPIEVWYESNESFLLISFTNDGEILTDFTDYINGLISTHANDSEGLDHIRLAGERNPKLSIAAFSDNNKVTFTLKITP